MPLELYLWWAKTTWPTRRFLALAKSRLKTEATWYSLRWRLRSKTEKDFASVVERFVAMRGHKNNEAARKMYRETMDRIATASNATGIGQHDIKAMLEEVFGKDLDGVAK